MSLFPIFVKLQGRTVVVVGGGNIAAGKIPGLLQAQARVRVIAPQINPQVSAWVNSGEILQRNLRPPTCEAPPW
jgi:siroheme synthase-like protein